MKKMSGKSLDLLEKNIDIIQKTFPEVMTEEEFNGKVERKIDFDKLRLLLGDDVSDREERYELRWNGKNDAIRFAQTPSNGTLRPDKESSKNWDDTENLYIEGDNLEVLKLLQKSYFGQIKMIYIDPPYNTGNDFVYKDDFRDNIKNYLEKTGQIMIINNETNGRYHTDWLNMMYPRLKLARNLLSDDGVIFISIDDNELSNTIKICDEIFGSNCFIGNICRATGTTTAQGTDSLGKSFDYLLIYSKKEGFAVGGIELDEKDIARYNLEDERGKFSILQLRRTGGEDRREDRPSMYYGIKAPNGEIVYPVGPTGYESRWRVGKETFEKMLKNNEIYFKKDKEKWTVYYKFYLEGRTKRPSNLWNDIEGNKKAQIDLKALIPEKVFDTPKPIELLKRLFRISNVDKEDIILDFFSGSATTAHAVMQLNAEDGGNRKFIMVQLPEITPEKSEARKAGYENICEIGKERIRRAGDMIVNENKDKEGIKDLDIGFKVFKLDSSNIKEWDPDNYENLDYALYERVDIVKMGRTNEDLLYLSLIHI